MEFTTNKKREEVHMNELTIFKYSDKHVRTLLRNGEPWFVLKDVCEILDLGSPHKVADRLEDDERNQVPVTDSLGRLQETTVINEPGLYNVILRSDKPEAKAFKRWITHEVIPTIRKTGGYVSNDEMFITTYLPFADDSIKTLFKATLQTVRKQNELILQQQKEIQHKEDVIIGLVDNVELAEKRQILNRVVRYKNANFQERWAELYRQFEMKYHIDIEKRRLTYNKDHRPKMASKLDYIDKVMGKLPELYEIACKLYESDIKELTEQMYSIC
jgi:prophage antirepressor-like protein